MHRIFMKITVTVIVIDGCERCFRICPKIYLDVQVQMNYFYVIVKSV